MTAAAYGGTNALLLRWGPALGLISALTGCGGGDDNEVAAPQSVEVGDAATRCVGLLGSSVPASAFGLSTSGATVGAATVVPADAVTGTGEYCKLTGQVNGAQAADPPIKFQVNLPSRWNTKSVQFGGGGFNGTVVTGEGNVSNAPVNVKTPLARGYATFGSDSGSTPDGSFGLNAQALANYGGESVKRTRDLAVALANTYYKQMPTRTYYIGGSKGGHEALIAAQRYAADYNGVVAYYPANQNQAMVHSWDRMWRAAYSTAGASLNSTKITLLKSKVLEACDALDGATDGIVANVEACGRTFAVNSLRCTGGADTGDTCLSDAQISTLLTAATPMQFAFPLANGVTSIGPYPIFLGGDVNGILFDGTTTGLATGYNFFDPAVIKYFVTQDVNTDVAAFDYRNWQPRVEQISALYDSTDPNIDAFKGKGAKLFIVQGTTDMLVTATTTTAYVNRLVDRYGDAVRNFTRYYVQPGFGHGNGTFNMRWDSLTALEDWVEKGKAPVDQVGIDANTATAGRTRPMCEYPAWPKYKGTGDVNSASSFTCATD